MKVSRRGFWFSVAASLVAAAIWALFSVFWPSSDAQAELPVFEGWLGDQHEPVADGELIDFVQENEDQTVRLKLHLGPEIASDFSKIDGASRTYSFALADPKEPWLMDLHVIVDPRTDFFFGVESPGTGIFRGTFRVVGCAQTGSDWFSCELHAVPFKSE
ncbi:MAG: hypothetical protein AABO58_26155 [Acidobacteriota bacterium]